MRSLAHSVASGGESHETATAISNQIAEEAQRWQSYLNLLALSGLKTWLSERLPNKKVTQQQADKTHYLQVGDFSVSAIAVENLLDETVPIHQQQLQHPTHFYAVIEVVEEEEEVIFRGLLRRDRLNAHLTEKPVESNLDYYTLPRSWFDPEPNHLVTYCQHLAKDAIALPVTSTKSNVPETTPSRTKLAQWLQDTVIEGWSTIENLVNPEMNLAFSTRSLSQEYKHSPSDRC